MRAGPMDPDAYNVTAKAEGDAIPSEAQFRRMMQTLLADRFQLKLHREMKEFPAYELAIAKNGHKLKAASDDPKAQAAWTSGPRVEKYSGRKTSMADLAFLLKTQAGRPVIDKTGLTGRYDFELEWSHQGASPDDANAPQIFEGISLGLCSAQ